jgi:hypothetical protein
MKRECKLIIFLELWMLGTKKMKRLQVNFFIFVVFTFLREGGSVILEFFF